MGQQVAEGDGASGGDDGVATAGAVLGDLGLEERRQVSPDGVRDEERALLLQHHRRHRDERLRLRRDAKDVSRLHRVGGLAIAVSEGVVQHDPAAARDQNDATGELVALGVSVERRAQTREPLARHPNVLGLCGRQILGLGTGDARCGEQPENSGCGEGAKYRASAHRYTSVHGGRRV